MCNQPDKAKDQQNGKDQQPIPPPHGTGSGADKKDRSISGTVVACLTAVIAATGFISLIAFMESQRAFLSITNIGFEGGKLVPGKRNRIEFVIRNSGPTTADISRIIINRVDQLPATPVYKDRSIVAVSVPAGMETRNISDLMEPDGIPLTQDQIDAIVDGNQQVFIYGFIEYGDSVPFLGKMRTGFCYVFEPIRTRPGNFSTCANQKYTYTDRHWAGELSPMGEQPRGDSTSSAAPIAAPATPAIITAPATADTR